MLEIAPLDQAAWDLAIGSEPVSGKGVTLSPAPAFSRWSLRAKDATALAAAIGHALPEKIGTHQDGIARLGPDEWFAMLPPETAVSASGNFSVVDVSSRAVGFTLEGPGAVAALLRGCPLDLEKFTPGRATRTVFETVEIQIWCLGPERFHVEVWRSFAPWLWHSLADGIA